MSAFWSSNQTLAPWEWILRALFTYAWLLLLTKIIGQREIGKLTHLDFIITLVMGSAFGASMGLAKAGLLGPVLVTGTLALLNITLAYLGLKSSIARKIIQGEPMVLVENGRVLDDSLRKSRFNLDDLMADLRQKNYPNLQDIEFAILESNGKLSVIPTSQARSLTPRDVGIATDYEGIPIAVIQDGNIQEGNLKRCNLDRGWLLRQLNDQGIDEINQVTAALLDTKGQLYISRKVGIE